MGQKITLEDQVLINYLAQKGVVQFQGDIQEIRDGNSDNSYTFSKFDGVVEESRGKTLAWSVPLGLRSLEKCYFWNNLLQALLECDFVTGAGEIPSHIVHMRTHKVFRMNGKEKKLEATSFSFEVYRITEEQRDEVHEFAIREKEKSERQRGILRSA